MTMQTAKLSDLNERSRAIFRQLVETYLETGDPVGSRTLSKALDQPLSPATVRNVMQDLEEMGLLGAPHVSAGRVPTQIGLRMFVDGLLEIGDVSGDEREQIERSMGQGGHDDMSEVVARAGQLLSGLTHSASLVLAPKTEAPIKHLEFVTLSDGAALVVLVTEDGAVENRMIAPPPGVTPSAMREAANFLNAMLRGKTLSQASEAVAEQIARRRQELDALAASLVQQGIAVWSGDADARGPERLFVRGRSHLLEGVEGESELERMRMLFDDLERKRDLLELLELAQEGEGVRIFIGSENKLFSLSGSSLVISPYMDAERRIIGALGVIGPTRLNYGRVVPIVDYTARLMGRLVTDRRRGGK
jgi:heat-inducible transcriptional repressor